MSHPVRSHETVARLKELLFDQESRELDTLAVRIAELQKRAGSDEQFQRSVAKVLEGALEEVEADRKTNVEVSEAMAPMVLRTFRKEMASETTKAQIADVMYPSMGQMVRRYVASAIQDMMEEINRRLDSKFNKNPVMLTLRSIFSRQSLAQQAMVEAQRLDVVEIYLVRRGSGELIHHWEQPEPGVVPIGDVGGKAGDNRDALISGFLSAITSFAEEAFEADKESLRTLNFDGCNIFFRSSPDHLLAAKCRGTAPDDHEQLLDQELLHVLGAHQAIASQAASAPDASDTANQKLAYDALLGGFANRLDGRVRDRASRQSKARAVRTLKIILAAIGLPLLVFAAWHFYVSWITDDLQTRADAALAEIPALKGYPVKAHVERGGRRVLVTGLVPDEATEQLVLGRISKIAAGVEFRDAVSILPNPDVDGRLGAEAVKRAVEGARRKLGVVATDLSAAQTRSTDVAEREALTAAEATARAAIGEFERGDPVAAGGALDRVIASVVGDLRSAAERLGALAGIQVQWPGPVPSGARESADALSLAAERVSMLVVALEQRRSMTPIMRQIDTVRDRMAERIVELEGRLEQLRLRPPPPPPPQQTPTPREQLASFVRGHAVFFSTDAEYRDAAAVARTLDALGPLLTAAGAPIRVVGYTDETGNAARNSPLAQARADKVLADLVARGVDRRLLIPVGRANGVNLAPGTGADSPNRRVEFEMAFDGEPGARP